MLPVETFDAFLRQYSWFVSCGIGRYDDIDVLYVYVKSKKFFSKVPKKWENIKVICRTVGKIQPAVNC